MERFDWSVGGSYFFYYELVGGWGGGGERTVLLPVKAPAAIHSHTDITIGTHFDWYRLLSKLVSHLDLQNLWHL